MTLSPLGFSFRDLLAYVTDAAGQNPILNTSTYNYASTPGWGWTGGLPFSDHESTTVPAIAGYATWTSLNSPFRIDTSKIGGAGTKYLRIGMGQAGNGAPQSLAVFDDGYTDGGVSQVGVNNFKWVASTAVGSTSKTLSIIWDASAGVYRLWKCTPSSTSAATGTIAPNGTGPTFVDGAITWTYIKTAIYSLRYTGSTNGILDATGVVRTSYTDWDANNAKSAAITVAGSFIEIMPADQLSTGKLRYFGIESASSPLQAATLTDVQGNSLGTSFTTYANEPPNQPIAKVSSPVGAQSFSLSGTLASYFTLVAIGSDLWLAHSSTRIPYGTTGTLNLVQTDNSGTFTGSPYSTALTLTLLDSGTRPTDTSVLGLLSTGCYLRYKAASDALAAQWAGVASNATFPDGDVTVTSSAGLVSAIAAFTLGVGKKFRIRLQNGDYSATCNITGRDFLQGGNGYLVIENDADHNPALKGTWYIQSAAMKGLEIRNCRMTGNGNGTGAFAEMIRGYAYPHVIVFRGNFCQAQGWVRNSTNDDINWFSMDYALLFRVIGNTFIGGGCAAQPYNVLNYEFAYNLVQQGMDDVQGAFHDMGTAGEADLYHFIHDNVATDSYGVSGAIHPDFYQVRTVLGYPGGYTDRDIYGPGAMPATAIAAGKYRLVTPNVYYTAAGGTTPARANAASPSPALPSHTSGSVLETDGTNSITWQFKFNVTNMPKMYIVMFNNLVAASSTVTSSYQFFINSGYGQAAPVAIFNNLAMIGQARGFFRESPGNYKDYIEYNTLIGPSVVPTSTYADSGQPPLPPYVDAGTAVPATYSVGTGAVVHAAHNFAAAFSGNVYGYGNVVVSGASSATAGKRYNDLFPGISATQAASGYWQFTLSGLDGSTGKAALMSAASRLIHEAGSRSAGARLTELYPITYRAKTAGNSPSNTVSLTIQVDP